MICLSHSSKCLPIASKTKSKTASKRKQIIQLRKIMQKTERSNFELRPSDRTAAIDIGQRRALIEFNGNTKKYAQNWLRIQLDGMDTPCYTIAQSAYIALKKRLDSLPENSFASLNFDDELTLCRNPFRASVMHPGWKFVCDHLTDKTKRSLKKAA
jgi:hypothetical protein